MRLVRFHNGDQFVHALAGYPGRRFTRMVWIEGPLRVHKVGNEEVARFAKPLPWMKPARAARVMLKAGRRLGITKSARAFLKSVMQVTA